MRIAYLMDEFPVLSQTFVLNQVRGLIERGHEIEIFADWNEPPDGWISDPLLSTLRNATRQQPAMPASRLSRLASAFRIIATQSAATRRALLGTLNLHSLGREATSLRLLHVAAKIRNGSRYDAVRACFGPNGVRATMLRELSLIHGPIATSFHGYDLSTLAGDARRHYDRLFASGEIMLPTSHALAQKLFDVGCAADKVEVLPSAIDCSLFSPAETRPLERPFHVVSVGRLVEKKGFVFGIQAVARMAVRGYDVRLTIAGGGPLRQELEATASECGVAERVVLTGALTSPQVRDLIREGHVLMAPSIGTAAGDSESRLNVVKEAFACEVPVVASRHGGIPELVTEGLTGFLVDEGDVDGLAHALGRLASNADLARSMGRRGRDSVVGAYDIETLTRQLEAILERLQRDGPHIGATE